MMLGWGLNIVVGLAGLLDLGYVAFYAVGAYSYALLALNCDLGFWACLPLAGVGAVPGAAVVQAVTAPLALFVLLLVLPVVFITLGGARKLSPGRVGLLLMGEAVVGITSAALLTDEPFGLRELIGTLLVLSAAAVEVVQPPGSLPAEGEATG